MNLPPGGMLSHYRVVEKIADGGMGVVYKVFDTRLERHVALKLLRPELTADPARRSWFLNEARANASVNHPNIAAVYEIDDVDGVTFIVMELVEGATLRSLIEERPLPITGALRIAIGVARGLARAHHARVIHRDLKPDNIIVGPDGHAKLLDFGLARILEEPAELTAAIRNPEDAETREVRADGRLLGTIAYMSPEQARGEPLDARTDIFSFGITLHEMITGKRPFAGASAAATLGKILEAEPEPLTGVPADLGEIVARCLRKSPTQRYATGGDLARALEDLRPSPGDVKPAVIADVSPTTIAVFPFSVRGSPEFAYLGAGMVDLLATKIDGAGELRTVDSHATLCCADLPPDPERARNMAHRFGAGLFVLGNVVALADQLHLDASLYDSSEGPRPVSKASASGAAPRIFEMVDQLAAELLTGRCAGPARRLTQIAAATTESFPALKAYLEGEHEMRATRRAAAVEAYERAVSLDPRFALAWYRLSVAALWSGRGSRALDASRRAVEHADRLTERDRLLLQAFQACLRGRNDEAERRFRNIVGTHPDDVEAWYQLGELLFHWGPLRGRPIRESRQAWERLLLLDPRHVNALVHLGLIEASMGNTAALEQSIRRVLELSPDSDPATWLRALWAYSGDDLKARERISDELRHASDYIVTFAIMYVGGFRGDPIGALSLSAILTDPVRSPDVRALGFVIRAHLELARGRVAACRAELDQAERLNAHSAVEYLALLSTSPFLESPRAELERLRTQVDGLAAPPVDRAAPSGGWFAPHEGLHAGLRLYLLGILDAAMDRAGEAARCAERLENVTGPEEAGSLIGDLALSVRAHAALAAGRHAEALEHLERARMESRFDQTIWSPFFSQARERYLRAGLLERLGRDEEAIPWYASFAENSMYDLIYLAPALRKLGGIYERLGQAARAAEQYARFEQLWKDCDPELAPVVAEARSHFA